MNIIVENLIKHIKSKPSDAYTVYQLEDFYHDLCAIYFYTQDKTDREELRKVFNRIVQLYNNQKKFGGSMNPGALDHIDKITIKF